MVRVYSSYPQCSWFVIAFIRAPSTILCVLALDEHLFLAPVAIFVSFAGICTFYNVHQSTQANNCRILPENEEILLKLSWDPEEFMSCLALPYKLFKGVNLGSLSPNIAKQLYKSVS